MSALEIVANPLARREVPYPQALGRILSLAAHERARARIERWPGYEPTALRTLPDFERRLRIGRIWYKDESQRFGLGSFKALGGAYAVQCLVEQRAAHGALTLACATDGNHGRAVAWGARLFGLRCVIFLHAGVSAAREAAIAGYGAEIVRVAGSYDDAVREAARRAAAEGWVVVSDTSYPGYDEIPRDVMQGYTVMVEEALRASSPAAPSHVFVQGGVGGLAAAAAAHIWERLGAPRPIFVIVEPQGAACLYESARAGTPQTVPGPHETIIAGLACGEVSLLAWSVLQLAGDFFMKIPDAAAVGTMRALASADGRVPIVAGEAGAAALAGLELAACAPSVRTRLGLDPGSCVLVFGTEGDTDPSLYARLVGRSGGQVLAGVHSRVPCPAN